MGKPITTKGQLCECGCGEYAKPGNRFIFNHHMRGRFGEDHANFGKKFPKYMIAIEYDGSYWHKGREVADKSRQDKLEANGWKFLRYVDYVPPMNQLIKDLQQIEDH